MTTVTSADGTKIAYERSGDGTPIILLGGAFNDHHTTAPLAEALSDRCTVLNCDRRGRGESGDTPPYSVEREIEDIAALIDAAGGSAAVLGYSSGATLVLRAAASGLPISKLALYEPPFRTDDRQPQLPADLADQLSELVSSDRRGDAVELYQIRAVQMPEEIVVRMREAPFRPGLEAIAHTLVYDAKVIGDLSLPSELGQLTTATLVLSGQTSGPFMRAAAAAVAELLPNAELQTLPGEGHGMNAEVTAPVIAQFLTA